MAELKKVSELKPSQVNDTTEFLIIDKPLGKTNRVSFSSLKSYLQKTGQKGKQGDVGEKGASGTQGPKGLKGFSGSVGRKGFSGAEGDSGDRGQKGVEGVKGQKGNKGNPLGPIQMANFKGDSGEVGETGQGIKGVTGDKGTRVTGGPGDRGSVGAVGENALKGPSGAPGRKGVKGITGNKGSTGANAGRGDNGSTGAKSTTPGPKGIKGTQGVSGINIGYKFNFNHHQSHTTVKNGFMFTEGSCLPYYNNDTFYHNNSGSAKMRGSNNRFQKIAGGNAWNAGIKSRYTKSTNSGAWGLTIVPNITQQYTMLGLSLNPTADYNSLDYAFYFSPHSSLVGWGVLTIREKGQQQKYGEESAKIHGISPNTDFIYLFTPGMQYHIDWDGVNKRIIYRVSNNQTGEIWTARIIACPWVNKNVYAAGCFHLGGNDDSVDATRYLLWR